MKGSSKQTILKHKKFKYKSYEIEAFEYDNKNYEKYENVVLISNVKCNENKNAAEGYFRFLADNREITKTIQSIVHENLVFLKFDTDYHFNILKKRLASSPKLNNSVIEIHEAYETLSVLVKLDQLYFNEIYLNEKFKIQGQMYWHVPFELYNSPFIILKFSDIDVKFDFLVEYSKIEEKEFLIENIFNVDLINEYLNKLSQEMDINRSSVFDSSNYAVKSIDIQEWSNDNISANDGKRKKRLRMFECEICPFKAFNENKLILHEKQHEYKIGLLKCRYCAYYAKMMCTIKMHEKVHLTK